MTDFSWHAVYTSDLQSLYALLVVPLAFLAWRAAAPTDSTRAVVPDAARFVSGMTLFFAVATMVDPISTGPLLRSEWLEGTIATTLIPFFFVLLGDLRVLLLAIGIARPERDFVRNLYWALGTVLIVPIGAGASYAIAGWIWPELHSQVLWMIYEAGFLALCIFLSRIWLPRALENSTPARLACLRALFGYSAAYYALWLIADLFIVVAQLDLGWAIRIVPNQLYYAFWVPFAYWRFFSVDPANAER
jgi:hypothetical protein